MNFLSHYYFDRFSTDAHLVLGTVLPDLVKNANKKWCLHPHKHQQALNREAAHRSMLQGWQRHLIVDKYFHDADFFHYHTKKIKEYIRPVLQETKVWPSFLAHISLELTLDSLLITEGLVKVDEFYHQLENCSHDHIHSFLTINWVEQADDFFGYFNRFLESRYLHSYRDEENVVYALNRISMRLWPDGLGATDRNELKTIILNYRTELKSDFKRIFDEIETHLHTN